MPFYAFIRVTNPSKLGHMGWCYTHKNPIDLIIYCETRWDTLMQCNVAAHAMVKFIFSYTV